MKAVILVGGKAIRMLPLTFNTPKALLPVLNIPFLEHVIRHLSSHQIKDTILAQGHLAGPIEAYLGDGSRFGIKLSYVVEDTPRGTAGAIKNTENHIDDTFLVLNGDIYTDLDITGMIKYHRERAAAATIALTPVDDPTRYGLIETAAGGRITRFTEKPDWSEVTTNMINAGTYVLEPDILTHIPPQTTVSIEREVFPQLLEQEKPLYAYYAPAYWIDIGTPEKYLQLHRDLLNGETCQYACTLNNDKLIGQQCYIHRDAQIIGPVMIGNNCSIESGTKIKGPVVIGHGCTIQKDSILESSVIWRNTQIGTRVHIKNTIIANNCCIQGDNTVVDSILGDNVTIFSNCKLDPGSIISAETTTDEIA